MKLSVLTLFLAFAVPTTVFATTLRLPTAQGLELLDGTAVMNSASAELTCRRHNAQSLVCDVVGHFVLTSEGDARVGVWDDRSEVHLSSTDSDCRGGTERSSETGRFEAECRLQSGVHNLERHSVLYVPGGNGGYVIPARFARHVVFGDEVREDRFTIDVGLGTVPFDTGSAHAMTEVELALPQNFQESRRDHQIGRNSLRIDVRDQSDALQVVAHGGPLVGIGVTSGRNLVGDYFLLQAGYEIGLLDFLVLGVSVDVNAQGRVGGALMAEIASPNLAILFPSFSLALGLPVELHPFSQAGVRLGGTVGWPAIGLSVFGDYWPSTGTWTASLLGRLSL